MFLDVLLKVASVFLVVFMGILGGRRKLIRPEALSSFNAFLFNFGIPCMILSVMQNDEGGERNFSEIGSGVLVFSLITVVLAVLSFAIVKILRVDSEYAGLYRLQIAFTNSGFMGIPLVGAIFGEEYLPMIIILNPVFNVLLYSVGIFILTYEKGASGFDREMFRKMINPPIITAAAGIVIMLTGFRFPDFINSGIDLVEATVSPLAMFIVGVNMSFSRLEKIFKKENLLLTCVSLIIVPLISLGVSLLLPVSDKAVLIGVFAMAMPSPAIASVLSAMYGKDSIVAAEGIAATTFFSLVTVPVWAWLLIKMFMAG